MIDLYDFGRFLPVCYVQPTHMRINECPVCRTGESLMYTRSERAERIGRIECRGCATAGPPALSHELAIAGWNVSTGRHEAERLPRWEFKGEKGPMICTNCGGRLSDTLMKAAGGLLGYCPHCGARLVKR